MVEVVKKRIVLTMQDGSMYGFDFDYVMRNSYQDCALNVNNEKPFYHLDFGSWKQIKPERNIEIMLKGGLTCSQYLLHDRINDFEKLFIAILGEEFMMYIAYPIPLVDMNKADNIIKNWSINFINYYLNQEKYDLDIAKRYLFLWANNNYVNKHKERIGVDTIKIDFRR